MPDDVMFSLLITCFGKLGDLDAAEKVLVEAEVCILRTLIYAALLHKETFSRNFCERWSSALLCLQLRQGKHIQGKLVLRMDSHTTARSPQAAKLPVRWHLLRRVQARAQKPTSALRGSLYGLASMLHSRRTCTKHLQPAQNSTRSGVACPCACASGHAQALFEQQRVQKRLKSAPSRIHPNIPHLQFRQVTLLLCAAGEGFMFI